MSKARGWGFYEKLRGNDIMIVQGNQQVVRHAQARRAADRGRRARFLRRRRSRRKATRSRRSIRRDGAVRDPLADLGGEGLAQSECRQAVRRVHDRRQGAEDLSGRRRLFVAHRHRAAGRLARPRQPEDPRGRLPTSSRRKPPASRSGSTRSSSKDGANPASGADGSNGDLLQEALDFGPQFGGGGLDRLRCRQNDFGRATGFGRGTRDLAQHRDDLLGAARRAGDVL